MTIGNFKINPIYVAFAGVVASIFASFYISYASAVGFVIGIAIIYFSDVEDSYYFLFALIPFAFIFKLGSISTSLFTMLEYLVILKSIYTRKVVDSRYFLLILPFVTIAVVSGFIVEDLGITYIVRISLNVEMLYLFINHYYRKDSMKKIAYAMTVGLLVSDTIGLFRFRIPGFTNMYYDNNIVFIDYDVQVHRFCGTFTDPNYFSMATIVALGLIMALFFSGKGNLFFALSGAALIVFGLMSYSKSFILMVVLLALVPLGYFMRRGNFLLLLFSLFVLIMVWESGILMKNHYIWSVVDRFTNGFNDDITSGRTEKWQLYFNSINSSIVVFLLGNGCAAPYVEEVAAHNIILDTWNYVGLLGVCAYAYMWTGAILSRKLIRPKLINWYLIAFIVVQYFFLNGFRAGELPFYLLCGWMVLNTDLIQKEEDPVPVSE